MQAPEIVQGLKLSLFLVNMDTARTKVLFAQFYMTQVAEKAAAMFTGNGGFLVGMIKTAGIQIIQQYITHGPLLRALIKRGENSRKNIRLAGRTLYKTIGVILIRQNPVSTNITLNNSNIGSRHIFPNQLFP